jgi:hypothetical protein
MSSGKIKKGICSGLYCVVWWLIINKMGTSASKIVERVRSLTDDQLRKFLKDDQELLGVQDQIYDPGYLTFIPDLDKYEVPGAESIKPPPPGKSEEQETAMYLSMKSASRLAEKHQDVKNSLQLDILGMRGQDPTTDEILKRLQALCRIHEALLREEERKRRRSQEEAKEDKKVDSLPTTAKVAIRFGVSSILSLIRAVGIANPLVYNEIITGTAEILSSLPPNSLQDADPTIAEAIDMVANFFGQILNGDINELTEEQQMSSLSPLLGLGITTGSLSSILSIAQRFLTLSHSSDFQKTLKLMKPLISQLHSMSPTVSRSQKTSWDPIVKAPDVNLSEDNLAVTRTNSNGWGGVVSVDTLSSGIHYYEFDVDPAGSDYLIVGVVDKNVTASAMGAWYSAEFESWSYQAHNKIWRKDQEQWQFEKWTSGGKIGMLVNMEEKHVVFFNNGKIMSHEPFGPIPAEVKLYCTFGGSSQRLKLNCDAEIPDSASEYISTRNVMKQVNNEEEEKELISHYRFETLRKEEVNDEELAKISPACVSTFMLACLDKINHSIRSRIEKKNTKIKRKEGLGLDVQNSTLESMSVMLELCIDNYRKDSWEQLDKELCQVATLSLLRLIRSHLLATQFFKDSGLKKETKEKLYKSLDLIMESSTDPLIGDEAAVTFSQCLEIFYEKPQEKLEYLLSRLEDLKNNVEVQGLKKQLQDRMFEKMADPESIYPSFSIESEENSNNIEKYLKLLIEISTDESRKILKGEQASAGLITLLQSSQKAFLSQGAKVEFKGRCQSMLLNYTQELLTGGTIILNQLNSMLKDPIITPEMLKRVKGTLIYAVIPNLLHSLIICKLNLDFVTTLLPNLQAFMASLSNVEAPTPVLSNGMGIVTEIYESDHPYPDSADFKHLVKVPNAKRYHLTFDPQFKTENGCDYLELWLDELKGNKHSRWEGEGYPKERVTVENPLLYFTFHSDGSVHYWGWKITIEAEVETQYYIKEWPYQLKDACRLLAAAISKKLISSEFEMTEEPEDVKKLLQNPLLKFGVKDKCHTLVKELEPLDIGLMCLCDAPGLQRKKSSISERLLKEELRQKLVISEGSEEVTLNNYVQNYGQYDLIKFSEIPFLNDLVEGNEKLLEGWKQLKIKAGVVGPTAQIGGTDLDKSERAIFAVYIAFFEISDTINRIFESQGSLSPIIKYLIKQSCMIRVWAQQYKQKQIDSGNSDITYEDISNSVLIKCSILLHSEYKLALNELGVRNVMFNLVSTVVRAQSSGETKLRVGSKWMAVKKAMKTMTLLRGLLGISSKPTGKKEESEDMKEFHKVAGLVREFLESSYPVDKLIESMEKRRTRALARALGFNCLGQMIGYSHNLETSLVRAFSDALRNKEGKIHFWDGLEGADPYLLACVKKSFFKVYELLQKDIARSSHRKVDWEYLHHYLAIIEAMSFPIRDIDSHMLLELQVSQSLHSILGWAKGNYGEQEDLRTLDTAQLVHNIQLIRENEIKEGDTTILVSDQQDTNRYFLRLNKGVQGALPIVDVSFDIEPRVGYEIMIERTDIGNGEIAVQVLRAEPNKDALYLTHISAERVPEYKKHEDLLKGMTDLEKKKYDTLKQKFSSSAWRLFKLIMLCSSGSPTPVNQAKTILVQELLVGAVFEQLDVDREQKKKNKMTLKEISSGETWLGKVHAPVRVRKNPMAEWIRQFKLETEDMEEFLLKDIILNYVGQADPAFRGVITHDEVMSLDESIRDTLIHYEDVKNSKGEYDFFCYLNVLIQLSPEFGDDCADFVEQSFLFRSLPKDFYEAQDQFNMKNILCVVENFRTRMNPNPEISFSKILDLFTQNPDTPGRVPSDKAGSEIPDDFKNSKGEVDFYKALTSIKLKNEIFVDYWRELKHIFDLYGEIPESVEAFEQEGDQMVQFLSSLLWVLNGCCGSPCLPKVLARTERVVALMKIFLVKGSDKLATLASRLLRRVIASQHSPQTISLLWPKVTDENFKLPISQEARSNFINTLLAIIGLKQNWQLTNEKLWKIDMMFMESQELLRSISASDRWREDVYKAVMDATKSLVNKLTRDEFPLDYEIGALSYMAYSTPNYTGSNLLNIEWCYTKLKNSAIARGTITNCSGNDIGIYNEDDDIQIIEKIDKLDGIILTEKSVFHQDLADSEVNDLLKYMQTLYVELERKRPSEDESSKVVVGKNSLFCRMKALATQVLSNLIEQHDFTSIPLVLSVASSVMKQLKDTTAMDISNYRKLLSVLVPKLKKHSATDDDTPKMTDQEASDKLTRLNEEDQIMVAELLSLEIPLTKIIKCIELGIKDKDAIISYEEKKPQKTEILFTLKKFEDESFEVKDLSGNATCLQNRKGYFIIKSKDQVSGTVCMTKQLDSSIFKNQKEYLDELTLLITISAGNTDSTFGFTIGDLSISIDQNHDEALIICRDGISQIKKQVNYSFRIFAKPNGKITVVGEKFEFMVETEEISVFNGMKVAKFGVWLERGNIAALKGFEIQAGHFLEQRDYWVDEDLESRLTTEHFMKVTRKIAGLNKLRLGLTGAPSSVLEDIKTPDLDIEAPLRELLASSDSRTWESELKRLFETPIVDLAIFDDISHLKHGFEPVKLYSNGELVDFKMPNRKILAIKRHDGVNMPSSFVSGISVGEARDKHEDMGDLTISPEHDYSNHVYIEKGSKDSRSQPIRNIIFLQSDDPFSVKVPLGYLLIENKEELAVNIGAKSDVNNFIYLAFSTSSTIKSCPIKELSSTYFKDARHGLVDSFDGDSNSAKKDETKWDELSVIELLNMLYEMDTYINQQSSKTLILNIVKKRPELFQQLADQENLNLLFRLLKDDLNMLDKQISEIIIGDNGELKHKLLSEMIYQFIICSTEAGGAGALKEINVESIHPYDNNMKIDEVYRIPGATRLRIEFDPQCHTESGCDTLRFYERPNHDNELRVFSGQGESCWQGFEVEGDTVHTYFYSDGSVVYWGYKFRIVPIGRSSAGDPLNYKKNPTAAVWLIEKIASIPNLESVFERCLRKETLLPLFIFLHTNTDTELKTRALIAFKKLLRGQKDDTIIGMLQILIGECLDLHNLYKDKHHPILQSIIQLLADLKTDYGLEVTEEWFLNFCETYYDMQAICDKDSKLEALLFEQYIAKINLEISQTHEIKNYDRNIRETQTTRVAFPHATSLSIEFDDSTKLIDGHSVYFSYDEEGKVPVVSGKAKRQSNARWAADPKGPDIALSNDNLTVTRTSSSSWGVVLWSESYSSGIIKITCQVDKDGASEYWYFGVIETSDNYQLSSYIGSDCSSRVWSWKTIGDFHKQGEVVNRGSEFGYRTGDSIGMLLDMDDKKITFIKNDKEIFTFDNIAPSVRPALCFGGSDQFMTVKSVELLSGASGSGFKKVNKFKGDSIYCHYPINSGYLNIYEWDAEKIPGVVMPNRQTVSRELEEGDHINVKVMSELGNAKYYLEVQVTEMPQESLMALELLKGTNVLASFNSISGANLGQESQYASFREGDRIGIYLNMEDKATVKFSKNGYWVFTGQFDPETNINFNLKLGAAGQSCSIVTNPELPDGESLMRTAVHRKKVKRSMLQIVGSLIGKGDEEDKNEYSIKFKACPVYSGRNERIIEVQKSYMSPAQLEQWETSFKDKYLSLFKNNTGAELVMYLDEYSLNKGKNPLELTPDDINPGPRELIYYTQLEKCSVEDMRELYLILQSFNNKIKNNLALINLHIDSREEITMVQKVFIGARNYIFYSLKKDRFTSILTSTNSDARPSIQVDRTRAGRRKLRGDVDSQGQFSCLGQIYRATLEKPHREFRNSERIFTVEYRGEGATDAGGPYNEVISTMCEELQSKFLRLLISTPNQAHNIGDHRDCWIINPNATTQIDQDLFLFLGKLFGVAIRTQNNLNLSLPPLFWKRLMLEEVNIYDLKGMDECCYQMLDILRNLSAKGITQDSFSFAFENETFTTHDSSGKLVELVENGKEIPVTFENAKEYSDLIERYRLNEGRLIYDLLRKGMSAVVPMDLLNMFSWRQVETLVCGAADIDVDILKDKTEYDSCSASDRHIQFFWEILKEFTPRERSLYLRFVWGRSRLPAGRDFRSMKITRYNPSGPVDNYMPISHTCFFTIDIPAYTNKDSMRDKLLYAITHCQAIDLDRVASGGWEEED